MPVLPAAARVLDALGDRRYRQLWLGGLCAYTARWVDLLTLGWVTLELTGSPVMVGVAAFARAAPMIALGPLAGLAADRLRRTRVMVAVQATTILVGTALAGLFAADRATVGLLIGLEVILGTAWAADFPVRRAVLSTLVEPRRLANAVSLESVSLQVSKIGGPALAGLLLGRASPVACYGVLVLLSLGALVAALALDRGAAGDRPPPVPFRAGLLAGLQEVRARPMIRAVLAITVVMNALVFPYQHLLAVFARDVLAVGPERLGLLAAANGVGALVASLAVAARQGVSHHAQLFAVGSLSGAVLVVVFALSPWYTLSLLVQFVFGFAEAAFGTMQSTIVLLASPDAARGRVMGILSTCIGIQPLGTLWLGILAGQVGAPLATAAGGLGALGLMIPVAGRLVLRAGESPPGAAR